MGRTIPSFRIAEEQEAAEWRPFRKALSKADRVAFDQMMASARLYTSASSAALRPSKFEGMAMAMVFHHYKTLARCVRAISQVERRRKRSA